MIALGEAAARYRQAADTVEAELGALVVAITTTAVERAKGCIGLLIGHRDRLAGIPSECDP